MFRYNKIYILLFFSIQSFVAFSAQPAGNYVPEPIEQFRELLAATRTAMSTGSHSWRGTYQKAMAFIEEHKNTIKQMRTRHGETALMLSAAYSMQDAIDKLIKIGMDIFEVDNEGRSILFYCISPDYCPELVDFFALKLRKTHQHLIEDAVASVETTDVVDRLWPLLDRDNKIRFAARCEIQHPAYAHIKKELLSLKKQAGDQKSIVELGQEVAQCFETAAAHVFTLQELAKLATKKEAQKRRKENKRKKALEEQKPYQVLAAEKQQKYEDEKIARLAETKKQEEENEKEAKKHSRRLAYQHAQARARKAFDTWAEFVKKQKKASETATTYSDRLILKEALFQWHLAKTMHNQELQMRLTACKNSFDLYKQIKDRKRNDTTPEEHAITQLELGRAQINLLLSGQRVIRLYAQRGVTSAIFEQSKTAADVQAKKLLSDINQELGAQYSYESRTDMITQFFKNASHKESQEETQAHRLFDSVRARDVQKVNACLSRLKNAEHANLNLFKRWLGAQKGAIPADAMIYGDGMRDILNMAYIEKTRQTFHARSSKNRMAKHAVIKSILLFNSKKFILIRMIKMQQSIH
jgi:hypothetical protein